MPKLKTEHLNKLQMRCELRKAAIVYFMVNITSEANFLERPCGTLSLRDKYYRQTCKLAKPLQKNELDRLVFDKPRGPAQSSFTYRQVTSVPNQSR